MGKTKWQIEVKFNIYKVKLVLEKRTYMENFRMINFKCDVILSKSIL